MGTWGVPTPPVALNITTPASDSRVTYALERMRQLEDSVQMVDDRTKTIPSEMDSCIARVAIVEAKEAYDPRFPELQQSVIDVKAELIDLIGKGDAIVARQFLRTSEWQSSMLMWQASTDSILIEASEWQRQSSARASMAEGRLAGLQAHLQAHLDSVEEQYRTARFSLETSIRLLEDRTKADLSRFGERVFDRINEVEAEVGRVHNKEIPRVERIIGEVAQQVVNVEKRLIPDAVASIEVEIEVLDRQSHAIERMLLAKIDAINAELALTWRQRFKRWWKRRLHGIA